MPPKNPPPELCSFCGRSDKVVPLIKGPDANICVECVEVCRNMVEEQQGSTQPAKGPAAGRTTRKDHDCTPAATDGAAAVAPELPAGTVAEAREAGASALARRVSRAADTPVADVSTAIGSTYTSSGSALGSTLQAGSSTAAHSAATTNATRGREEPAPRPGRKDDDLTG